ncbi:YjcZ family sporulation protein [Neobacillus mesonae]|nr:YjcZ family sporulation protein [Neobacillus mesonae]
MSGVVGNYGYGYSQGGYGGGNTLGAILVLFILLVIISKSFSWGGFGY